MRGLYERGLSWLRPPPAALVYNLQASLHCTRWHGRSAAPKKQTKRLSWQGWKWLRNVAQRQLSNKATTDCYVPCAGAFRSFGRQKNIIETTTMIIATNGNGKNYEEYKIIRYKNTVFLTPPSLFAWCWILLWGDKSPVVANNANSRCPLKRGGVKLALQGLTKTIAIVIYKQIRHRK